MILAASISVLSSCYCIYCIYSRAWKSVTVDEFNTAISLDESNSNSACATLAGALCRVCRLAVSPSSHTSEEDQAEVSHGKGCNVLDGVSFTVTAACYLADM